ncbi:MAG: DMT family transporter [Rhodoferax sp.]|nr:DMT family transporter [Rhodoferax sp.]
MLVADRRGALLVFASAAVWSLGGVIAKFLSMTDPWAVICWRSVFAALFLLCFMLWRNGWSGTKQMFRAMGWAGIGVGLCFATASTCFVVALGYTTVANILLMQAGAPLIAALAGFLLFRERVDSATWLAILAVIGGVGIMVSNAIAGRVSPIGDGLALLMSFAVAGATVLTRRHAEVRMMPAVCFGCVAAACVAGVMAGPLQVKATDATLLFVFGALNLGLGMALFVTGVRLLPAALGALIGTVEPVLGPIWVWLVHGEVPGERTLLGGSVVILALVLHLAWQFRQQGRRDPATGVN